MNTALTQLDLDHAAFIRNTVANAQIMYTECYTEFDEADIFDSLDRVSLDDSNMPLADIYSEDLDDDFLY